MPEAFGGPNTKKASDAPAQHITRYFQSLPLISKLRLFFWYSNQTLLTASQKLDMVCT
jgi:hypothetical protein